MRPQVSKSAIARLCEINADRDASVRLRVAVLGGGCSGFRYDLSLVDAPEPGDVEIGRDGQSVLVDAVSMPFLAGAEIGFEDALVGQRFRIDNPNAVASCGCGTSFAV